jgi:hypothetical protein
MTRGAHPMNIETPAFLLPSETPFLRQLGRSNIQEYKTNSTLPHQWKRFLLNQTTTRNSCRYPISNITMPPPEYNEDASNAAVNVPLPPCLNLKLADSAL